MSSATAAASGPPVAMADRSLLQAAGNGAPAAAAAAARYNNVGLGSPLEAGGEEATPPRRTVNMYVRDASPEPAAGRFAADRRQPSSSTTAGNERLYEAYNELHALAQLFEKGFDCPAILVVGQQTDGKSGEPQPLPPPHTPFHLFECVYV